VLPPSRPLRLEYLRAFGWQARGGSAGMVSRSQYTVTEASLASLR
jgi:hypothetical protein